MREFLEPEPAFEDDERGRPCSGRRHG
jgi:hypothetical protein